MMEIALKLLIVVIFLSMNEIPYLIKVIGIGVLGTIVIVEWNTDES